MIPFIIERRHLRVATFIIHRVWPVALGTYLLLLIHSPIHLRLYGFGYEWMSEVPLAIAGCVLFVSAAWPKVSMLTAAAMALSTWALLGRGATFILDLRALSGWTRAIGAGAYFVLAMATAIIYFGHVAIDMEKRMRGSGG